MIKTIFYGSVLAFFLLGVFGLASLSAWIFPSFDPMFDFICGCMWAAITLCLGTIFWYRFEIGSHKWGDW